MHKMTRRCNQWDYCDPAIYMISITQSDRFHPLLGKLVIDVSSPEPERVKAHIDPSPLGLQLCEILQRTLPPSIEVLKIQLMEEHLHFILWVHERLDRPLGKEIAVFKSACTQVYRNLFHRNDSLFSDGFQDTILFHKGQLDRMYKYLADNPRRLAVKRLCPFYYQKVQHIPFNGGYFSGIGNAFLLQYPRFFQIQVSRSIAPGSAEFDASREQLQIALSNGSVAVSPCISKGEKLLAKEAFQNDAPLIVLRNNGFPPLYKPQGKYFDSCAKGLLLMLSPIGFGVRNGPPPMTRNEACILNAIAQQICGMEESAITYHYKAPDNLAELVKQALCPQ